MRIFVLDNYDSFTYNLVQYLSELGAVVTVERNDAVSVRQIQSRKPDGIVLSPGPGRPENSGIMNDLVKSVAGKIPMLGVCLGHQSIAQVFGGTIGYAPVLMHGKTSEISHDNSTLFRNIPSPFTATRYHSLIVERQSVPDDLTISAWTDDDIVMGLRHVNMPLYGVQFHPESILTVHGKGLLKNFLETIK